MEFNQIKPEESAIMANALITPDGTVLQSHHSHDCQAHTDKNGFTYMIDGGLSKHIRTSNDGLAEIMSISSDDDHSLIRDWFCWGSRGKDGDQPLRWIKLKDMEDGHIKNILDGNFANIYHFTFTNEIEWRKCEQGK